MQARQRRGFGYIEAVISVVILGSAVAMALHTFGAFARGALFDRETTIATELAAQLAAEIRSQAFEDPGATIVFGPEADETDGTRQDFDDVDDYNGWTATPPQQRDGTPMDEYPKFSQNAVVEYDGSTDLKKITVTVAKDGQVRAELLLLRARHDAETR
ncbi:MAG TPA: hypothetical protein PKY77_15580 [Phycisphaerae bacterium]|nr:hypothetical protein [Phycisphaerae bacterium]HRY66886.1 hypothetical protein [Phycisphaerae bacterium]HSA26945.1 hypothetical protein [Phycisphaerae bacterium]